MRWRIYLFIPLAVCLMVFIVALFFGQFLDPFAAWHFK
jgi:hypothetical protein